MAARARKRPTRGERPKFGWGGKREGAGRKPRGGRGRGWKPGVPHLARPEVSARHPVHVTWRLRKGLSGLTKKSLADVVESSFEAAQERLGVRLLKFSIDATELRLVVRAKNREDLSRAMQGLGVRIARRLNGKLDRAGGVFADRYGVQTPGKASHARVASSR